MTYEEIIQSVGKTIKKSVYYYDNDGELVNVDEDNIEEIKLYFNADIVGTLMKGADITLKEEINTENSIKIEIEATYGEDTATKVYGPYYLKEKATYNADDKTYTHKCYDKMITTMVDYEPITITFPTTVQTFFNSLINTLDLTSSVSLVNGSKTLDSDIYYGINYSYRSVLQDIAEANGLLFYIDDNTLKTATLGTDTDKAIINDDILRNTNIEFGDIYGPVNTLILSRSADSDRIYFPEVLPDDPKEFTIYDNQLMNNNDRNTYMSGIYNKINGLTYDIFDTELVGYGGFKPLQKVEFTTGDNTYTSYVFNNEITFTDGYKEVIYSDSLDENNEKYKTAVAKDDKVNQISLIVNKQEQTITGVVGKVNTYSEKIENSVSNDDFREYKQYVETTYLQNEEGFTFNFDKIVEEINKKVNSSVGESEQKISKYIKLVDGNIILGYDGDETTQASKVIAVLTNEGLFFCPKGTTSNFKENSIAYFSDTNMEINDATIFTNIKIGKYAFTPRNNGSLSFGKVVD